MDDLPPAIRQAISDLIDAKDLSSLMQCSKESLSTAFHAPELHLSSRMFDVVPRGMDRSLHMTTVQTNNGRVERFLRRFRKIVGLTITSPLNEVHAPKQQTSLAHVLTHAPKVKRLTIIGKGTLSLGRHILLMSGLQHLTNLHIQGCELGSPSSFSKTVKALKSLKVLNIDACSDFSSACKIISDHLVDLKVTGTYFPELKVMCKILTSVVVSTVVALDIIDCPILREADLDVISADGTLHLTHVVLGQWEEMGELFESFPMVQELTLRLNGESAVSVSHLDHLERLTCCDCDVTVEKATCPRLEVIIEDNGPSGTSTVHRRSEDGTSWSSGPSV